MKKLIFLLSIFIISSWSVKAQFYTSGNEPASSKWSYIETDNYKIIYLQGLDSLARVYARTLENTADVIGNSSGFGPNSSYKSKMPVILRSNTVLANGLVTWTPRRMELNTTADAYAPEAYPWEISVGIHESRHSTQMQFAGARPFVWGKVLSGDLLAGGLAAIYPGPAFMEGDAVVAETALSKSGRGRSADFLEYYRVSFAEGDFRNFWQWRYGSQRYYTPDYYRAGYLAVAGLRTYFNIPDFTAEYYRRIAEKNGVTFLNFNKTVKELTGTSFKEAFSEISHKINEEWEKDEAERAPFIESTSQLATPEYYSEFGSLQADKNGFYALLSGITRSKTLVYQTPGKSLRHLQNFSSEASNIRLSPTDGSIYWSEYRQDPRWSYLSYSEIYRRDSSGRRTRLSHKSRYFNPSVSEDGKKLSVSEYALDGRSRVLILDSSDGKIVESKDISDGTRVVETVWVDGEVYFSAITDEGFGIWRLKDMSCLLEAQAVKIKDLWEHDGEIMLCSDINGVNELYALSPENGSLFQITSTRFGSSDFSYSADGNWLFYTQPKKEGRLVYATRTDSLLRRKVDAGRTAEFPMAEKLSSQEKEKIDFSKEVAVSETRKYSRLGQLIKLHSWVPAYVNIDNVNQMSSSELTSMAAPGASLFFQNDLGDAFGSVSYKAMDDYFNWRHSAHLKFSYTGLFPVLEFTLDVNDRQAREINFNKHMVTKQPEIKTSSGASAFYSASLKAYIPLDFSSGGIKRGIIPQIKYSINNDQFINNFDKSGSRYNTNLLTMSLRGYMVEHTAASKMYPNLGIGAEIGYSARPDLVRFFNQNLYAYLYAYTPGLHETHGIKFEVLHESRFGNAPISEGYANTAPRGFDPYVSQQISAYPESTRFSINYAMPLMSVDWSGMSPLFYLKNFEFTPHADMTLYGTDAMRLMMYSIGADLTAKLGNFLWIPYDTRIGVSFNHLSDIGIKDQERYNLSLIFNIDF